MKKDGKAKRGAKGTSAAGDAVAEALIADIDRLRQAGLCDDLTDPSSGALLDRILAGCQTSDGALSHLTTLTHWMDAVCAEARASLVVLDRLIVIVGTHLGNERKNLAAVAREAFDALLRLIDAADSTAPSSSSTASTSLKLPQSLVRSSLWSRSLGTLDRKESVTLLEAVLERYGATAFLAALPDAARRLVESFEERAAAPARRGKLILALWGVESSPKGYQSTSDDVARASTAHQLLRDTLLQRSGRQRSDLSLFVLKPLLEARPQELGALLHCVLDGQHPSIAHDQSAAVILAILHVAKGLGLCRIGESAEADHESLLGEPVKVGLDSRPVVVVPTSFLEQSILSSLREVRVDAASIALEARSITAPITSAEAAVLRSFFSSQFASGLTEARHNLRALLLRLALRARASCHAAATLQRKPKTDVVERQRLQGCLDLVRDLFQHLFALCRQCIHPAAPYHVAISGLSTLDLLLITGIDPSFDAAGRASEVPRTPLASPDLQPFAISLDLCTPSLVQQLLRVADSTFPELQGIALGLLSHFPAPLPGLESREAADRAILHRSSQLMLAEREAQTTAAARLLVLYHDVYIQRCRWPLKPDGPPTGGRGGAELQLDFIDAQLDILEGHLDFAGEKGSLEAATHRPMHGVLHGLQALFAKLDWTRGEAEARSRRRSQLNRLQNIVERIWAIASPILSHKARLASGAADHEIARTLAALDIDDEDEDEGAGGKRSDQETLLSYSWRAMKEAAVLLAQVVAKSLASTGKVGQPIWSASGLDGVGQRYIAWLLAIRHRGTFSHIHPAFGKVVAACLAQDDAQLQRLPSRWMDSVLDTLEHDSVALSTTRRSAGVGFCLLALLADPNSPRGSSEAGRAVDRLHQIAAQLHGDDAALAVSRVHALNVIRILVDDSTTAARVSAEYGRLLILAIDCFESLIWNLRNSSMMLFSSLFARVFPGGSSSDKTLAASAFFSLHPDLGAFLASKLRQLCRNLEGGQALSVAEESSVFAILLLLSRIQVYDALFSDIVVQLEADVRTLLSSRAWKVREQAAMAYRGLVLLTAALGEATKMVSGCSAKSQNEAHGRLLCAQELVRLAEAGTSAAAQPLLGDLRTAIDEAATTWIPRAAPAVQSALLELAAVSLGGSDLPPSLVGFAETQLRETPLSPHPAATLRKAGQAHALEACVALLALGGTADLPQLLTHPFAEVRNKACSVIRSPSDDQLAETVKALLTVAEDEAATPPARIAAVEAATDVVPRGPAALAQVAARLDSLLLLCAHTRCIDLREALLPLLARASAASDHSEAIGQVLDFAVALGDEDQSVQSRQAAIDALQGVAHILLPPDEDASSWGSKQAHSVFKARCLLVSMLLDDDEGIRDDAGRLAASRLADEVGAAAPDDLLARLTNGALRRGMCEDELVRRAWAYMARTYEGRSEWDDAVWTMLLPSETQLDADTSLAFQSKDLFAPDRANLYVDRIAQLRRAQDHLESSGSIARRGDESKAADARRLRRRIEAVAERIRGGAGSDPQEVFVLTSRLLSASKLLEAQASTVEGMRDLSMAASQLRRCLGDEASTTEAHEASEPLGGPGQSPRRRIAMVSDFFAPNVGGVEGHIFGVSRHLQARGHKVVVITHAYSPDRTGVRYVSGGLKVYYVPYQVIARQDTLPNFLSLFPMLRSILIRERIEIIHGHQALSSMAHEAILHARTMGLRAVFTDHSLFGFNDAASILTNKLLRFALSDVNHVVCVSHTGKENTVLRAEIDPHKVSVVPNAVVPSHFKPKPDAAYRSGVSRLTIIVLSRLMYRKGIDLLIGSIPRLCEQHPDVDFIIGGDGPKRVELEQMRERHLLHARVELCGAIKQGEVQQHLNRGHIFLNTSLTEAFGTGIIEAACTGLFVVSTRVGGVPEILPEGMMLLAAPDEDEIVRATSEAIAHVRSGAHDPHAHHAAVASMYSWDDVAERLEGVYDAAFGEELPDSAQRLARYRRGGPFAGLVFCIIVAVDMIVLAWLEWVYPPSSIDVEEERP